jgi:hypothetical protein
LKRPLRVASGGTLDTACGQQRTSDEVADRRETMNG